MKLIGVDKIIQELKLVADINPVFPHTLIYGPYGSGKTTIAEELATITKQKIVVLNAPVIDFKNIYTVLLQLEPKSILFIDEIHRLSPKVEEVLYQPMISNKLSFNFQGQLQTVDYIPFTLVGATTKPGGLSKPLLSRFRLHISVPRYTEQDLADIIRLNYPGVSNEDALRIAQFVSVPRNAINLAFRLLQLGKPISEALDFLGFAEKMSKEEQTFLETVGMGKISEQTLCRLLQLDIAGLEILEDRLILLGFVIITGRGREITPPGLMALRRIHDKKV